MTAFTGAGLYRDMSDHDYFADPVPGGSLSHSGSRKLLPPYAPAIYRHELNHPAPSTPAMDFGKVAHRLTLGTGASVAVVEADDWRSKAARDARDAAFATGQVPLLARDYVVVQEMQETIASHPSFAGLFSASGNAEVSGFWQDPDTGIWCRARYDWLQTDPRCVVVDFKTSTSAYPPDFARPAADYGYASQAAWYLDGLRALGVAQDPVFVFAVQSKKPPYLVSLVQLDAEAMRVGAERNAVARRIFARCQESGVWPGYPEEVHQVGLPLWFLRDHDVLLEQLEEDD